jgi:hypothetical protein
MSLREEIFSDRWQPEATSSPIRRILERGVTFDRAAASLARDCRADELGAGSIGREEKLLVIVRLRWYDTI